MQLVTMDLHGRMAAGVTIDGAVLNLGACSGVIPSARGELHAVRAILQRADGLDDVRRIVDDVRGKPAAAEQLRDAGAFVPAADAKLTTPIPDTRFILCCGANYRAHLEEMDAPVPDRPISFAKCLTSLIGPGDAIVLPRSHPSMVDWEGEFAIVVGRACHDVSESEALDYVAGYTLINDVGARDWVAPISNAVGFMGAIQAWEHNILGKMFPTFCPMGPTVVTRDEIPDPNNVHLTTRLNGEVMQSASTNDLVFGVAELISYYSRFYTFRPGDIISTGSPAGVGYGRKPQVFMHAGDLIAVHADKIGALSNPVTA